MTRDDLIFKILFAIQLALLPIVILADLYLGSIALTVVLICLLVVKIWQLILKNKHSKQHLIILNLGDILMFLVILILFAVKGYLNVVAVVFALVFLVLALILEICLYGRTMPDSIEAIDYCLMLFICFALLSLSFVKFYSNLSMISLYTIILTAGATSIYKIYYVVRYTDCLYSIKNFFVKLFKRK